MATANNKIKLTSLDFDTIKQALIDFLSAQTEFSDYNFAGAGLNVLIDLLAYNDQYMSYFLNMIANEMFLDSADLRENIVSRAKELNYVPGSRNAATAVINCSITPGSNPASTTVIDKFTKFTTSVDSQNYTFCTLAAQSVALDQTTNKYIANNLTIREGLPFTFQYTVDSTVVGQRFIIPTPNIDLSTLIVSVQENSLTTQVDVYNRASDINVLDNSSLVYFIQEVEDLQYQVYFGNGVLGKALADGNIIILEYLVCNADAPNSADSFLAASAVGGFTNVAITTSVAAFGGAEREDTASIKFHAPKNYEAQGRAVTVSDYKTLLTLNYPNVDAIAVWGGEDNVPPQYGKVFLSLKPKSGFVITEQTKQLVVKDILKQFNIVTIIPEIIDPDYIYLEITSLAKYDANHTTLTADVIKNLVYQTINNFAINEINKFERVFRYSRLCTAIDLTDSSITNNLTTIRMQKKFSPVLNDKSQNFTLAFNNPILPGSINTTTFTSTLDPTFKFTTGDIYGFQDDSNGVLQIYKLVGSARIVIKKNAGSVNYATGLVKILNMFPHSIIDGSDILKVFCVPQNNDIAPVRNNILIVDPMDIKVSMETSTTVLV